MFKKRAYVKVVVSKGALADSDNFALGKHFSVHFLQEFVDARTISSILVRPLVRFVRLEDGGVGE